MLHDAAVTIVIPAYNEQGGIAASLDAVEHAADEVAIGYAALDIV